MYFLFYKPMFRNTLRKAIASVSATALLMGSVIVPGMGIHTAQAATTDDMAITFFQEVTGMTVNPSDIVTRRDMIQALAQLAGIADETCTVSNPFTDLSGESKRLADCLQEAGITKGESAGIFGSGNLIFGDLVIFVARAAGLLPPIEDPDTFVGANFGDAASITDADRREALTALGELGIVFGVKQADGSYNAEITGLATFQRAAWVFLKAAANTFGDYTIEEMRAGNIEFDTEARANVADGFVFENSPLATGEVVDNGGDNNQSSSGAEVTVSLASDSPAEANIPRDAANVGYTKVNVRNTGTGTAIIREVMISRGGLGDEDDFDDTWITENGVRISNERGLNEDGKASVQLTPVRILEPGQEFSFTITAEQANAVGVGRQNYFEVPEGGIDAGGATVRGSFPIRGAIKETADFLVGEVSIENTGPAAPAVQTIDIAQEEELASFRLRKQSTATDVDFCITSMILEQNGAMESEQLQNLFLRRGNEVVTEVIKTSDSDEWTFIFLDNETGDSCTGYTLLDGEDRVFDLFGTPIGGDDGDALNFEFDNSSDLSGYIMDQGDGITYSPRVVQTFGGSTANSVAFSNYRLDAGDIAFSRSAFSPENTTISDDTTSPVLMLMNLNLFTPIEFKQITFANVYNNPANTTAADTLTRANVAFDNPKLVLGHVNDEGKFVAERTLASENDFTIGTAVNIFHTTFDDDFVIEPRALDSDKGPLVLAYQMDFEPFAAAGLAVGDSLIVRFLGGATNVFTAEYINNGDNVNTQDITGGIIDGSELTAGGITAALENIESDPVLDPVVRGAQDIEVLRATFSANDSERQQIEDVTLGEGPASTILDMSLINGCGFYVEQEDGTMQLMSEIEDFNDPSNVTPGDATLELNDIEGVFVEPSEQITFAIQCDTSTSLELRVYQVTVDNMRTEDSDGDAGTVTVNGATLTAINSLNGVAKQVVDGGTLSLRVDSTTEDEQILPAGTDQELGTIRASAQDDDIDISDLGIFFENGALNARMPTVQLMSEDGSTLYDTASLAQVALAGGGNTTVADFSMATGNRVRVESDKVVRLVVKAAVGDITEIAQTGQLVKGSLREDTQIAGENSIQAISGSTGIDLSLGTIDVVSEQNGTQFTVTGNTVVIANGAQGTATYNVASPRDNFFIGQPVIVTDAVDQNPQNVTVVALTSTTISVQFTANNTLPGGTLATDRIKHADSITAVAVNAINALNTDITVGTNHSYDVGNVITIFDSSAAATSDTVTVLSVTQTTVTYLTADLAFTAVAGDYAVKTSNSTAAFEEHVIYNTELAFSKGTLKTTAIEFSSTAPVGRLVASADAAGDASLVAVSIRVSATDVSVDTLRLVDVDNGGDAENDDVIAQLPGPSNPDTTNGASPILGGGVLETLNISATTQLNYVVGTTIQVTGANTCAGTAVTGDVFMATVEAVGATTLSVRPAVTLTADGTCNAGDLTFFPKVGQFGTAAAPNSGTVSSGIFRFLFLNDERDIAAGSSEEFEAQANITDANATESFANLTTSFVSDTALAIPANITATAAAIAARSARVIFSDQPNVSQHNANTADFHDGALLDQNETTSTTLLN